MITRVLDLQINSIFSHPVTVYDHLGWEFNHSPTLDKSRDRHFLFSGTFILSNIPPALESAFAFITPAIFGAVLGQFAYKNPLYGLIAIAVGMAVLFAPIFSFIKIAASVGLVIAIVLFMEKRK